MLKQRLGEGDAPLTGRQASHTIKGAAATIGAITFAKWLSGSSRLAKPVHWTGQRNLSTASMRKFERLKITIEQLNWT